VILIDFSIIILMTLIGKNNNKKKPAEAGSAILDDKV
jgi:hypothetical protein